MTDLRRARICTNCDQYRLDLPDDPDDRCPRCGMSTFNWDRFTYDHDNPPAYLRPAPARPRRWWHRRSR